MKSIHTPQAKSDFQATLFYWKWASETGKRKSEWPEEKSLDHLCNNCACCEYFMNIHKEIQNHACKECFLFKGIAYHLWGPCLNGAYSRFTDYSRKGQYKESKKEALSIYTAIHDWMEKEGLL